VIHGAERQTQDFDCVAQSGQENLQRLALAMRELTPGCTSKVSPTPRHRHSPPSRCRDPGTNGDLHLAH
jgi:hypothetical protein